LTLGRTAEVPADVIGADHRASVVRSETSTAYDADPDFRVGRAGELRHRIGELLLLTFAEVRLDMPALNQHRVPGCARSVHP